MGIFEVVFLFNYSALDCFYCCRFGELINAWTFLSRSFWAWSFLTGIQLEYVLLNVEEGWGRKVLALASLIVLAAALVGIYSHVDCRFIQVPPFRRPVRAVAVQP